METFLYLGMGEYINTRYIKLMNKTEDGGYEIYINGQDIPFITFNLIKITLDEIINKNK